jgi:hypothetical protein
MNEVFKRYVALTGRRKSGEFAVPVIAQRMMAFLESSRPNKRWLGA